MDHEVALLLDPLLGVVLDAKPQISRMVEDDARVAVDEHEASDVELLFVEE